jgi:hypothetical protein
VVWAYFKAGSRENPKKSFEHKRIRKMPKWETEIKIRQRGQKRYHTERQKNMEIN